MSESIPSIISVYDTNSLFLEKGKNCIIDTWCPVDISLEDDTDIDSPFMSCDDTNNSLFLCPGIYLDPYSFLGMIYMSDDIFEGFLVRKDR